MTIYSPVEVARKVGVTKSTAERWVQLGYLKAATMGNYYLVTEDDLNDFVRTYKHGKYLLGGGIQCHDDRETMDKCLSCEVPGGCCPESPLCKVNHGRRWKGQAAGFVKENINE